MFKRLLCILLFSCILSSGDIATTTFGEINTYV